MLVCVGKGNSASAVVVTKKSIAPKPRPTLHQPPPSAAAAACVTPSIKPKFNATLLRPRFLYFFYDRSTHIPVWISFSPNSISTIMDSVGFLSASNPLSLFFAGYLILYLIAYSIIFRGWASKLRPEASSCAISLAHGTPAVFLAARAILADPARDFHSANTPLQSLVLDYSIAYFLMDLVHYLIFYPTDLLFIGHHLATLFVFVTCRYVVHHGAFAILVLLILAEVTSFCQNVWTLAGARRSDTEFAAKVFDLLSPPFYALYSVVRGFLGPYFVYRMFTFYLTGAADTVIPKWVWISWVVVVVGAISVSILWILNLWVVLFREKKKKKAE